MVDFRCRKCNKLLARYTDCHNLEIKCTRCGMLNIVCQWHAPGRFAVASNYRYFMPLPGLNPVRTDRSPG